MKSKEDEREKSFDSNTSEAICFYLIPKVKQFHTWSVCRWVTVQEYKNTFYQSIQNLSNKEIKRKGRREKEKEENQRYKRKENERDKV